MLNADILGTESSQTRPVESDITPYIARGGTQNQKQGTRKGEEDK